jgi:carbamoyl-phosphate synthase large subunit
MNDLVPIVTGVGGAAGVSVVIALRSAGIRTVAADCDAWAAGLALGDASGVLPRADDPGFISALCKLAADTGADAVVPTVAEELVAIGENAVELADAGIACWVPSAEAVNYCLDKAAFAGRLHAVGIATPATAHPAASSDDPTDETYGVPGPWIVKPRFGRGSRGVHAADDPREVTRAVSVLDDAIVQSRLAGREFTVDALVDREGRFAGGVPRWRHEVKAGISTKGETFADPRVLDGTAAVLAAVGLRGVANVQGFVTDDGEVVFVEVNPRFSGGLPLSLAAGADLVGEYLRGISGLTIRDDRLGYRPGVRMARYYSEVFTG